MSTERTIASTSRRADQVTVGDTVVRRSYLRAVKAVDRVGDAVVLTIDRGFDEVVTEHYQPTDLVEVWT